MIHAKGTSAAYYVLLLGVWGFVAAMYFNHSVFLLLNLLIGVIVVAESIRIGTQLYYYRRGY